MSISLRRRQPKQVDLSEVLDFKSILESYRQNGDLPPGIVALHSDFDRPLFCLESRPGINFFIFMNYCFSVEVMQIVLDCDRCVVW